jgi:hypothetical protein
MSRRILLRFYCGFALATSLGAAYAVGTRATSAESVLAAFTGVLLAASLWVLVETHEGRRWFVLGFSSGIAASLVLVLMQGTAVFAIDLLGPKSRNELWPRFASGAGAAVMGMWLGQLCGIGGGALAMLRARRAGVPLGLMWFLMIAAVLGMRSFAAHEPPDSVSIDRVAVEK